MHRALDFPIQEDVRAIGERPCHHCQVGEHDACWGSTCFCYVCCADDKDEFDPRLEKGAPCRAHGSALAATHLPPLRS